MQKVLEAWNSLDVKKQVTLVGGVAALFTILFFLARMASQPSMALLYAGLDGRTAGDVVSALEQRNVPTEVRGSSIFVPSSQRDELRMLLASDGLPSNNTTGYELLDGLSGFGTTSQMFDAAYWRAKEGELARTILVNPSVRSARVHIAAAETSAFRPRGDATASVSLGTDGVGIEARHAKAIRFLVSSAVPGLLPDNVTVIDDQLGLILTDETDAPDTIGSSRAADLREQVLRLLEARLGAGNAVVEIAVETVTESEAIRQRTVDPQSRVAVSTETEETSNTSNDTSPTGVTVASNLPDGDAAGGGSSNSQNSQTRETVNYEISQTEREVIRAPGAIKRLSVAVMVNSTPQDATGEATTEAPLAETELQQLRELVESAVGFDADRGDTMTLQAMPFTQIDATGTLVTAEAANSSPLDVMMLIQTAVLAVVALLLGLFVVRPILLGSAQSAASSDEPVGDFALPDAGDGFSMPLTGEIDDGLGEFTPIIPAVPDPGDMSFQADDPIDRLRNLINERRDETVEVLRGWLEEKGEKTQ